jgi:uncharacterized protein (TIGR00251 family)
LAVQALSNCSDEPFSEIECSSERGTTIKLPIKVVPGSSRSDIVGWLGDTLKIRVTAPAERGKANAAVTMVIAERLGIPNERVHVVTGHTSARKIVEIVGLSEAEVHLRLSRDA